ncbi:hypothetical protein JTB14_010633 [Gonioctena quinquepunctata]|nr:hypothetical protein JTB14_010633 [Gonioctena quinquepunctata]
MKEKEKCSRNQQPSVGAFTAEWKYRVKIDTGGIHFLAAHFADAGSDCTIVRVERMMVRIITDNPTEFDVIYFRETWIAFPNIDLTPHIASQFNIGHSLASGGMAILHEKYYNALLLDSFPWWLFELSGCEFIICGTYFNPSYDSVEVSDMFQTSLLTITETYNDLVIFVLRDFNSRIGELSSILKYVLEITVLFSEMTNSESPINDNMKNFSIINIVMSPNWNSKKAREYNNNLKNSPKSPQYQILIAHIQSYVPQYDMGLVSEKQSDTVEEISPGSIKKQLNANTKL